MYPDRWRRPFCLSSDQIMRVTFVVPVLDTSGGARIIAGHAQRLAARGHQVVIVAPKRPPITIRRRIKAALGRDSLPVDFAGSHYARARVPVRVTTSSGLVTADDVPDADVIIATFWTTAEWIWSFPVSKGAKVHFIQHYEAFPEWPGFRERVEAVWRLPTYKIAIAKWLTDLGRDQFGIQNIALVPNSVDHELFAARNREKGKGEPPTVGFLFHHAAFKDVPTSVAAIKAVQDMRPDTRVISFGGNRPRPDELPARTEFHFRPTQEQIARIYASCDVWLSTSTTEGFNLPPLEAMASGCPVVCSRTGRPAEIIENGANGYLVEPKDVAGFTDALAKIISLEDEAWQRMSDAAMQAVAHPTWTESSALFEQALLDSIGT